MKKVLLLLTILLLVSCESKNQIGDLAYDFSVEDFEGKTVNLSDFEDQAIYILAWSTT
ncbi:MAG: hypothetical protein JEZ08_12235 [Clostridiales bacterium]|nr:hypothetical protein [Clostridiales bacterium]